MGEIKIKVHLADASGAASREEGKRPGRKLRALDVEAVVDTGAVMLLLPQDMVEKLGLRKFDKRIVVLANEQKVEMEIAGPLALTIADRTMNTDCLVGPPGCEPLVGQLVMEALDLIADPVRKTLTPRPESPYLPTLKLK